MKEQLDSDRVNYLIWRFVYASLCFSRLTPAPLPRPVCPHYCCLPLSHSL